MKKFSMSIGIVILAMLIGLTMTACQNPAGGGKKARTYTVTMQNDGNGTASANKTAEVAQGETVRITATPNDKRFFKQWQVVSGGASLAGTAAAETTFTMPSGNVTIKAGFLSPFGDWADDTDNPTLVIELVEDNDGVDTFLLKFKEGGAALTNSYRGTAVVNTSAKTIVFTAAEVATIAGTWSLDTDETVITAALDVITGELSLNFQETPYTLINADIPDPTPVITGVSVGTATIASVGGDSVITVAGTNLVDGITVTAFDGETETNITGTTSGSWISQTVTLTFPANTSTTADKAYTVKSSLDGGENWAATTETVTVKVVPAITGVSAATTTLPAAGGSSIITVTGTNLLNGIKVTAFDGASATSITGTTSGSGTSQTVTLTFHANTSTTADKAYTVKSSLDGGTTWAATTETVTVKAASAITNVSANITEVSREGGSSIITVTGTNLANGIRVTAFDGATATGISGTTSGSGTSQTVTLTFPMNPTRSVNDKTYTVKASLNSGTTWATQTAAVTVPKAIGWIGPSGGLVFYGKGDNTGGWRYLEAAPAAEEFEAIWGPETNNVTGTQTGIGTGKNNTQLIVAALNSAGETGRAAQRCVNLNINGITGWFLPSKDELNEMFYGLKANGLGGFSADEYWSSSQYEIDTKAVWIQGFNIGGQSYYHKNNFRTVRPIRAF